MSDSGDPKQDRQRELEAEREHYSALPNNKLDIDREIQILLGYAPGDDLDYSDVVNWRNLIEQLLFEARLNEMEMAQEAWLTKSLVNHINDRTVALKQQLDRSSDE